MPDILVIRLKTAAVDSEASAEWLVVDSAGTSKGRVQGGALMTAAALVPGRKVVVLVPGTDVLLAEPVLPLKGSAKLAQVVPFALEEQLAADVEDLHFAVGKRGDRPGTPVAVASHERMGRWQAALRQAGIVADALYAETAVLPVTANGVTILIDGARVYVRRESTPGAVLDVEPLIEALQLALASGEEAREHVTIYLSDDDYERERDLLEGLREFTASLQLKLLPGGALTLLAAKAVTAAHVNLLQGQYAPVQKLKMSFAPWRHAAVLAVAFVVLHFGVKTWQHFDLKGKETQLDSDIAQVFQQTLPGAPMAEPLQARKVMESRLSLLRGTGPTGGLLSTLATLSEAIAQAPGTRIETLAYRNNITDLRVTAPSVDVLDKLQHAATERGMSAQIQSTGSRDSKTEARLQFKSAGT
jgi:general secretion pathway protein L